MIVSIINAYRRGKITKEEYDKYLSRGKSPQDKIKLTEEEA